jgi:hypothetical protein
MYQIANGTNSAIQSATAIQTPVETSIAQLLPGAINCSMQAAVLGRERGMD